MKNYLMKANTIMSKIHVHGLPPTIRKVKDTRFNGDIIGQKHGTRYIIFLKAPSILTNIISNKDMPKEFMVTPTNASHMQILSQPYKYCTKL